MRTFKCRGGLANDEPLQLELVATASDRRSSTQKELPLLFPRSRSGPVRYVCRQGYVQPHAPMSGLLQSHLMHKGGETGGGASMGRVCVLMSWNPSIVRCA